MTNKLKTYGYGLIWVVLVVFLAIVLDKTGWFKSIGFSVVTLAILVGLLLGNTLYPRFEELASKGVHFAKGPLLRLGIILYGFNLTFQQVAQVGVSGIVVDIFMLSSTFILTVVLAKKVFKVDMATAYLMASGASVCGAAAIMAAEPIVKGQSHRVAVAVATVVVFGTISIFLYPVLYHWNPLGLSSYPNAFGVYIGSTVHEVAQVVAAGHTVQDIYQQNTLTPQVNIEGVGVTVKMIRVMMLTPMLLILSYFLSRHPIGQGGQAEEKKRSISIPWFAILFIVMVGVNSIPMVQQQVQVIQWIRHIDLILLSMAMGALGMSTHYSAIQRAGVRPLILGGVIYLWLMVVGMIVNGFLV